MKNALIIVNALLVIAVGYLLYKQTGNNKADVKVQTPVNTGLNSGINKKLVFGYIETDSIQSKYELAKNVQREIKKKESAITSELEKMDKDYKNKLAGYQKKAPTMTEEQANAARQDMESTQTQMMERRQSLTDEFNSFVASKNMSVMKEIKDYLKKFNADGRYSFIFSYEPGLFYYKDSSFDITSQVLKGLNEQFKAKK